MGERTLDALLLGQGDVGTLGAEPYALAAAAFAHEARKLDELAGKLAAPRGAGVALANKADDAAN